ncbi:hypothetical protein OZ410_13005 [Robiginitalea sp. M366]|uniref:hypothetical protein n=1 Tax=Robiginitalea aestuariiviva TaxID=3036903 RepID=UPI00240D32DE|nr:hypothetical protein [Robiginitalea aestuariiviva]MDG1573242.1 hypothetical protein [Robiginitalea aestuariiviva]
MFRSVCSVLCLLALSLGCNQPPGMEATPRLEGYWEIDRVEFPGGGEREYTVNTSVNYYHLDGNKGYLKKMQPNLDGTFQTSDDALPMEALEQDGQLVLRFQGETDTWEERVETLEKDRLVTLHANDLRYHYRRYEPLTPNP